MANYQQFTREFHPQPQEGVIYLDPSCIKIANPTKPTEQRQNAIIRLSASVKKYGILEPIEVRAAPSHDEQTYELIEGERRLKAAVLAGIDRVPCRILSENDRKCRISAILMQLHRESLHFFEQAAAFRMLTTDFSLTQEEIARRSAFSQSAIANKMRLLALSKEEQLQIVRAELTERHARAILRLKAPEERRHALAQIKAERLTVAATEQLIERMLEESKPRESLPITPENRPTTTVLCPQTPPKGQTPRKFALGDLTPLYNSIERTLSIFRKTGATATCTREEGRESTRIIIDIPQKV